jgi:protease-4
MLGILSYRAWLIEPQFAARIAPVVMRAIEQGNYDQFIQKNRQSNEKIISSLYSGIDSEMIWSQDMPSYHVAKAKNGNRVAIIPMMGAITKNGDACSYGMRDYQNVMSKIAADPSISAVVFHFNNAPGGSHDGTPEISHNIFNYSKPTIAFVDGMAASAHYYMASQTDHIMMNALTDSEVGSIGSLIVSENVQNMIDAGNWPKTEIIRAPQSTNKALFNYIEPLTDSVRAELDSLLKDGVSAFIQAVKNGRPALSKLSSSDEIFTGKMYGTKQAIANGMADSKGSLMDAVNKAANLKYGKSKSASSAASGSQAINTMKFKSKLISAHFGQSESAEETPTAEQHQASLEAADTQAAELETANAALVEASATHATQLAEAQASVTELTAQVSSLTTANQALTTEKAALQTANTELQAKLAAKPNGQATTIISNPEKEENVNGDGHQSATNDNKKYMTSIDQKVQEVKATQPKASTKK